MTLTFNRDTYGSLLAKYQPKIIETEEENEQAIALCEQLSHVEKPSLEESAFLELLITLIEKYEAENYPISQALPHEILTHLMESRNLDIQQLLNILGTDLINQEILTGERKITDEQAKRLSMFFNVSSDLFRL
ncbi:MAG: transcriptional regulator [Crocosphaera sp.]|nr:transcriptional regulator [Crocosphaera sp.]